MSSLPIRPQNLVRMAILAAPAIVVFPTAHGRGFQFADSAFVGFGGPQPFRLVHFATNAVSSWSFLPGIAQVLGPLGYAGYAALLMLTFAAGAAWWLGRQRAECGCRFHEALLIASFGLIVLCHFGIDVVLFSLLACIPLLIAAAKNIVDRPEERAPEYIVLGLASALNCVLCHQLAVIAVMVVFFVLLLEERSAPSRSRLKCIFVALFIPAFAAALFSSGPEFPAYSSKGHLVPLYGVVDGLQPLIGSAPRLNTIDRQFLRAAIMPSALVLTLVAFVLAVCERFIRGAGSELLAVQAERRAAPICALILAVSVLVDSALFSGTTSQLGPVQSLGRMVPGLYFFPLSWYLLPISLLLLLPAAAREPVAKALVAALLVAALIPRAFTDRRTADAGLWQMVLSEPDAGIRAELITKVNSPSYYAIREFGLEVLKERAARQALSYRTPDKLNPELTASAGADKLPLILDGKDSTRWSAGGTRQQGGEWLMLRFPEPIELFGVRLETGRYYTDFPRGVQIRLAELCSPDEKPDTRFQTVFRRVANEGEVLYTADGYPYFSEQHNVSLPFEAPVRAQCLLIEQIGRDPNYEWSVSELELASPLLP